MHKIDLSQLKFIDETLRLMMDEIEEAFGPRTITSLYRIGDTGVHGTLPLRGIDISCTSDKLDKALVQFVNKRRQYDPQRLDLVCAKKHDVGQGIHIHLQTHPNTIRI